MSLLLSLNFPPSFQARGQQQLPAGKVGRDSKAENPAAQTQAQAATGEPLCILTQSELIEPVLLQAAQLGIHFFLSQHTVRDAPS